MIDEIKKYQVVSNGEVLKGFSILDVAESLSRLYKIPSSEAIDTLICGKSRKVRSARSKVHAESICAKLQALGLSCGVAEIRPDMPDDLSMMHTQMIESSTYDELDDDIEPLSESTDEAMASIDAIYKDASSKVAKNKFIKRITIVMILLCSLGFGSWYALTQWLKPKSTAYVDKVELAMESLSSPAVLVFGDLSQSRKLSSLASFIGQNEVFSASDLNDIAELPRPLSVLKSGVILRQSDFLNASVYSNSSSQKAPVEWVMVLSGQFDSQSSRGELEALYDVTVLNDDLLQLAIKPVSFVDSASEKQCLDNSAGNKNSEVLFASITNDSLVFTSTAELNYRFQSKLKGLRIKSSAPSEFLQKWQASRQGSLISVNATEREVISEMPFVDKWLNSAFENADFDSIEIKVDSEILNQGVSAELQFFSADVSSYDLAGQSLLSQISEAKDKTAIEFPAINAFLSRIVISKSPTLTASIDLNGVLVADINGIGADLVNISSEGVLSRPIESIELSLKTSTDNWDYSDNIAFLKAAQKKQDTVFAPLYERQGVSIYVDYIGSANSTNSAVKLTAVRAVPKVSSASAWSESGIQQLFGITDVLNDKGKSILGSMSCIAKDAGQNSIISADGYLKTSISTPLVKVASPDDINRLKGYYELNVPTSVQRVIVALDGDRKVSWPEGYFRLSRIQGSTVQYRSIDYKNHLLAVHAMNANDQILSQQSVSLDGDVTTVRYNGVVEKVALSIAGAWESERFEFTLNSVEAKFLKSNARELQPVELSVFNRSEKNKFRKKMPSVGMLKAFPVGDSELGRSTTKSTHMIFDLESSKNVPTRLSGHILMPFNQLLLADPNTLSVYVELNKKYKAQFKPSFSGKDSVLTVDGKRYLKSEFSIKLDKEIVKINSVSGELKFNMPSRFKRKLATIGKNQKSDLELLSYDYSGNGASYYRTKTDADIGLLTSKAGVTYLADTSSPNTLKFNEVVGSPKNVELINVTKRSRFSEKFKLSIK
jgi:hypothetical protein